MERRVRKETGNGAFEVTMKGEVRKRVKGEVGSVNRMMSIGRFLENKGRMLQGGGESALLELHTSGIMLHPNWALGKRLRGEEDLLHEKCRKDWRG